MQEIKKYQNSHGYDCYILQTDNGQMVISFEGNLDLYWRYVHEGSILNAPEMVTLEITKENYAMYNYFDTLYYNILTKKEREGLEYHDYLMDERNPYALMQNGSIIWASDDYEYESASKVSITPGEEVYYITFEKSKALVFFNTFCVRFRNSGSRYNPYNTEFMQMYMNMKEYDPENKQIHFEELLYAEKKLVLTKEKK